MAKKKAPEPATVESIFKECEKQVRKGLGKKKVTQKAKDYWTDTLTRSIGRQLEKDKAESGGRDSWTHDKKYVLPIAKKMGKVAAVLAGKGMVLQWAAEAALVAVKHDPSCPAPPGGGGYCEN